MAAVAAGGLIGSALRTTVELLVPSSGDGFPITVLAINLAGSFLLGFYLSQGDSVRGRLHFWAVGVFGSLTTFSTFSVNLVQLLAAGRQVTAATYLGASVLGGLAAALAGRRVGGAIR